MFRIAVAISGQSCVGSTSVGRLLAKKLKVRFFSPGEFFKKQGSGLSSKSAIFVWKTKGMGKNFHEAIDDAQRDLARNGNIVIVGKISIHVLNELAFKIWLKASKDVRVGRLSEREGFGIEEAKKTLEEKESLEREGWKRIYGFDYYDQEKEANLVIDTENKSVEEIVKDIISKLPDHITQPVEYL